jgi:MFS family permease
MRLRRSPRLALRLPGTFPSLKAQPRLQKALRMLWLDAVFEAISEGFFVNYLSLHLLDSGGTVPQVGLLNSLGNTANVVAQMPGARAAEKSGRPKALVMWSTKGVTRVALLLLALAPFALKGSAAVYGIMLLAALRSLAASFGTPAHTSLLAELVPIGIRGQYLSSRQLAMSVCTLVVVPLAGQVIQIGGHPVGYQTCFMLALVAGLASAVSFSRLPESVRAEQDEGHADRSVLSWKTVRHEVGFLRYCMTAVVWMMGIQVAAPFFAPYMVQELGFAKGTVGLVSTINTLASLVGMRVFGPCIDRRGARWVMTVTGLAIPLVPLTWVFVRTPWHAGIIALLAGSTWAGYNLGSLNLLLALAPEDHRERYVALLNTLSSAAAIVGPLIGGLVYASFGFRLNLVLSGAIRYLGILLFVALVRENRARSLADRA